MYSVAVLVVAYGARAVRVYNEEKTEVYAAPTLAHFEIEAVAVLFRLVTAQAQEKCGEKPQKRERQAPREREKVKNEFWKLRVHFI